jgi:hypothetical protein
MVWDILDLDTGGKGSKHGPDLFLKLKQMIDFDRFR